MNRTDRLYALVEELRRAGSSGRTSAQLAAVFEVGARTIKRDVLALQEAGTPIWARAGPGGGYVLDSMATLPPVNFTPAQAMAVAVALASVRGAPFAADGATALAKVYDAMGEESRRRADDLGRRLWLNDDPANPPPGITHEPEAGSRVVEEALRRQVVVVLDYIDARGVSTRRKVEPMMMALTYGHWYLCGWCRERNGARWFRWDRIRDAHLTREPAPERDLSLIGEFPATSRPVSPDPR